MSFMTFTLSYIPLIISGIVTIMTILLFFFNNAKRKTTIEYDADIERILEKNRENYSPSLRIETNFIEVQLNLKKTQKDIQNVLKDIENQMKLFHIEKEESKQFRQIASINKDQYTAFEKSLINVIGKHDKKNNRLNIICGIIFCILSAILGNILPPIFKTFPLTF